MVLALILVVMLVRLLILERRCTDEQNAMLGCPKAMERCRKRGK